MQEEAIKYIDAEQYTGKQDKELTFRQIVLNQLSRITQKMTQEWHGGFLERRPNPNPAINTLIEIYVPDTRQEFFNGVNCLHDLLIAYFDKEMIKDAESVAEELQQLRQKAGQEKWKLADYNDARAETQRRLFQGLTKFLFRIKYLESKIFEEEA